MIIRQGDVLLFPIGNLPEGEVQKHTGSFTITLGEATGHHHTLQAPSKDDMTVVKAGNSFFVDLKVDTPLRHQEHKEVIIPKGTWIVGWAMEFYGSEELLKSSKALHIKTSERGNELWVIPKDAGVFSQDEYFLKSACPSTGRVYFKSIAPEVGKEHDPDFAQASTFAYPMPKDDGVKIRSITKEEYASLSIET